MHTNEQAMGKGAVLSCDVCGAEVGTNERLLRHVEREHAYQCPVRRKVNTRWLQLMVQSKVSCYFFIRCRIVD